MYQTLWNFVDLFRHQKLCNLIQNRGINVFSSDLFQYGGFRVHISVVFVSPPNENIRWKIDKYTPFGVGHSHLLEKYGDLVQMDV